MTFEFAPYVRIANSADWSSSGPLSVAYVMPKYVLGHLNRGVGGLQNFQNDKELFAMTSV
jgi:hypothetical protein